MIPKVSKYLSYSHTNNSFAIDNIIHFNLKKTATSWSHSSSGHQVVQQLYTKGPLFRNRLILTWKITLGSETTED